jgi:hypothetical protein
LSYCLRNTQSSADMNYSHSAARISSPALLTRILFRIFDALCCGAVLLDSRKAPIQFNERARKCLGESLATASGRLCATDRTSDALFQTILDQSLKIRWQPDSLATRIHRAQEAW